MLIKFDLPRSQINSVTSEIRKDADFLKSGISSLKELDDSFDAECKCLEEGKFIKFPFNFEKPMTVWDKKKIFKNYGLRL